MSAPASSPAGARSPAGERSPGGAPGPVTVIVLAKRPAPGQVKTRLSPPLDPAQAALVAAASLRDTLAAVTATPGVRRLLAFDGDPAGWLLPGWEVVAQPDGAPHAARIAAAFAAADGPALLVGMDTPQVTPAQLAVAARRLLDYDAVLGPAADGGWWLLGQRRPDPAAVLGVPMSTGDTCWRQWQALRALGWTVSLRGTLRDIDTADDLRAVSAAAPHTQTAQLAGRLRPVLAGAA